jgi:SAM-dependent methyltransferase
LPDGVDKGLQARHARYRQQATWTAPLRQKAYQQAGIKPGDRILEVGCGTGAILGELSPTKGLHAIGIDIDVEIALYAHRLDPKLCIAAADGLNLPFPPATFNHCLCHFLLMWTPDPAAILREMRRVTRPGGAIMALAEPDYAGRIDYPPELCQLGELQRRALGQAGAQPDIGRMLLHLLLQAGLHKPMAGVLGGEWPLPDGGSEQAQEWEVLIDDLRQVSPPIDPEWLAGPAKQAFFSAGKLTYVPTFYAIGYRAQEPG